jgi:hypothetical protein
MKPGLRVLYFGFLLTSLTAILSLPVKSLAWQTNSVGIVNVAASLYVNPNTGSDDNDGSSTNPLRTVQKALALAAPGTTIRLQTGTYNEQLETVRDGLPDGPIIIEPADAGAKPVFDLGGNNNAIRFVNSHYIFRNIELKNFNQGIRIEGAEYVVIDNVTLHHGNNEGIRLRYFSRNNVVKNCKIYVMGLSGNGEGIYLGTAPEQREKNNYLPDETTHNVITSNEIFYVTEGIDIKEDSSFNTISDNHMHDTSDPNSGGINVRADDNELYGNVSEKNEGSGFRFGGDSGVYSPYYGDNYHYGRNNILRNNFANDNKKYGYKFMWGPQDADCSNTGSSNVLELYHFASGVDPFIELPCENASPVVDIGVTGVSAPASVVQGDMVSVNVTIQNVGNQDVTTDIGVTLMDETDGVIIGTQTIIGGLSAGGSMALNYSWGTGSVSPGNHTLTASHDFTDDDASNDSKSTVLVVNETMAGPSVFKIVIRVGQKGPNHQAIAEVYSEKGTPVTGEFYFNSAFMNGDSDTVGGGGFARLESNKVQGAKGSDVFEIKITNPGSGVLTCSVSVSQGTNMCQ